ncbi:hypothetical protein Q7C36_022070 [Tachysurus vachellii]|uniref:Claudin n=1 Tax=Tachysurus vachellii TaxID=175792 RepID=A0AA88LIZ0_TACVA|nr:claudin-like protein ZF-A9 [Tachysurus vachellii]KAK2818137.1 hypothetical protein Q7C36_022070 [Tachysurus vachellii]
MSAGLQMLGTTLGVLGWLGTILACALPLWRVTAFIGNNIVTAQVVWEGLWMTCVVQSTGQMQCKVYDSMLALSSDLQASRAILIIAPLVSLVAILASIAGNKCTNCLEQSSAKTRVATAAGVFFLIAGILSLVPPSWMANAVIRDFYNPLVAQSQKRELGASIFICWGAAALTMIGGGLMCSSCPSGGGRQAIHYKPTSQTSRAHAAYV